MSSRLCVAAAITLVLAGTRCAVIDTSAGETPAKSANRWEGQVEAYEKQDRESPPPEGAVLFVGSSSVRMWKGIPDDFKPMTAIARGIGGSQISDQIHYAERLVIRYRPRQIVFYAGDNDVWAGKTPERILADYKTFVAKVRKALPRVPIHFLAIKPSPRRAKVWPQAREANRMVRQYAESEAGLTYIDVATPMLDADGAPRTDIFLKDMLHLNRKGYEMWIPLVKAALAKGTAETKEATSDSGGKEQTSAGSRTHGHASVAMPPVPEGLYRCGRPLVA
jgi:lysophospholipase L1-like esterase